ncbi:MAG: hypothetical protein ACREBR_00890, partial [bacterium]
QINDADNAYIYNNVIISSVLYKRKLEALGLNKRGRKKKITHFVTAGIAGGTVSTGNTADTLSGTSTGASAGNTTGALTTTGTASAEVTANRSLRSEISPVNLSMTSPADDCSDAGHCSGGNVTVFAGEVSVPGARICPECNRFPTQHSCKVCEALVCGICCSNRGYEGAHVCSKVACMRIAPPF